MHFFFYPPSQVNCGNMRMEVRMAGDRRKPKSEEDQKMEKIDMSGLSLNILPNPSVNVTLIGHLDLSNNNLESIPESLTARLLNVVYLDVHSNQIKSLPNSIGCLKKLKVLNVSGNLLESLPKTIEDCGVLEELNANFNKLTKLPDTMGFELHNLRKLSVNSNKLIILPYSTSHLTNLRVLDARLNCLRALPEDIENLLNLEVLNVSQNFQYLTSLPESIGLCFSLLELDLSYNKITTLPTSIGCLQKLQKLHVEGNPLVSPPLEVTEKGVDMVKEYLCWVIKGEHENKKKGSWLGKMVRHKTFNFNSPVFHGVREKDGVLHSHYRRLDGLASPRQLSMFSPKRLFSPKSYFSR